MEILSHIEIFTESFVKLSSYILGSSREIFPQGIFQMRNKQVVLIMNWDLKNICSAATIIQIRIELRRKEKRISCFSSLNIGVLGEKDHSHLPVFSCALSRTIYFNLSYNQNNGNMISLFMVGDGIS